MMMPVGAAGVMNVRPASEGYQRTERENHGTHQLQQSQAHLTVAKGDHGESDKRDREQRGRNGAETVHGGIRQGQATEYRKYDRESDEKQNEGHPIARHRAEGAFGERPAVTDEVKETVGEGIHDGQE